MIEAFSDKEGPDAHNNFQAWRRGNPEGFFLNSVKANTYKLHHVDCRHVGDTSWEPGDYSKSLTRQEKLCSLDPDELSRWVEARGGELSDCADCIEYE